MKRYYVEFNELWPDCTLIEVPDEFQLKLTDFIELTEEEYKEYFDISQKYTEWNNRILKAVGYYPKDK